MVAEKPGSQKKQEICEISEYTLIWTLSGSLTCADIAPYTDFCNSASTDTQQPRLESNPCVSGQQPSSTEPHLSLWWLPVPQPQTSTSGPCKYPQLHLQKIALCLAASLPGSDAFRPHLTSSPDSGSTNGDRRRRAEPNCLRNATNTPHCVPCGRPVCSLCQIKRLDIASYFLTRNPWTVTRRSFHMTWLPICHLCSFGNVGEWIHNAGIN